MNEFVDSPAVRFGLEQLVKSCGGKEIPEYVLGKDEKLPAQSYFVHFESGCTVLTAGDEEGALHALLDLADSAEIGEGTLLTEGLHRPYILNRGIKLNAPLDARAPSYTDCGDSAQENIAFMWEESFWQGLLDRMALQRYNALTLWNLCPFPVM